MAALILALAGLAFLDSLNVLNVGVVSAVIFDSRLGRRSPIPGALSFVAGVFAVTTTFGLCTVLGISFITQALDFHITPAIRFRGELLLGIVLIGLAYFPLTAQSSAPGWAMAAMRKRPWLLDSSGWRWEADKRRRRCPTSPAWPCWPPCIRGHRCGR